MERLDRSGLWWSNEETARLKDLWLAGVSHKEIARQMRRTPRAVSDKLYRCGLGRAHYWPDARVARLRELHAQGLTAGQIARIMGETTRNAVIGKLWRLGLSKKDERRDHG